MSQTNLKTDLKKYFSYAVVSRLLLLLFIAYLITTYAFAQVRDLTTIIHRVENVDIERGEYSESQYGGFENAFDEVSSLVKAPIALLSFDIYLENYRQAEIIDSGEKISTLGSFSINDVYTHEIRFGETKRIPTSTRGSEVPNLLIVRSFVPENNVPLASTTPLKDSFYRLYILPTWGSWFFLYFVAGIPLAYAVLAIINACWRFVLKGRPFTDKE